MYTMDCTNPTCIPCKQASEGKVLSEDIQEEIEVFLSGGLLSASDEKAACLKNYKKVKDEVHYKIGSLIYMLREREQDLCNQLDQHYAAEIVKIDNYITDNFVQRLFKRNYQDVKFSDRRELAFVSDFDELKSVLQDFGRLCYKKSLKGEEIDDILEQYEQALAQTDSYTLFPNDPIELNSKPAYNTEICSMWKQYEQILAQNNSPNLHSDSPNASDSETAYNTEKILPVASVSEAISRKLKQYEQILAHDNIPTLNSNDPIELKAEMACNTEKISSASFAMPLAEGSKDTSKPQKKKEECLLEKKFTEETLPQLVKLTDDLVDLWADEDSDSFVLVNSTATPDYHCVPPTKSQSWFRKKRHCLSSLMPKKRSQNPSSSSDEDAKTGSSDSCEMKSQKSSTVLQSVSTANVTKKEDDQESSSSRCLKNSVDNDPSLSLLASFQKYLEKTSDSEWLSSSKSLEQLVSSADSWISHEPLPLLVKQGISLSEWLPKKDIIETNSDWLWK